MILECTSCGRSLKISDEHAGKKARCPSCRAVNAIPMSAPGRVAEPVMQPAAALAGQHAPLPMSASPTDAKQTFIPAPSSTAMVPVSKPNYGEPRVQPYNPQPYQQQYAPAYQRPQSSADPGVAALLEVLGGMFMQTFGIGHIYAGNVTTGLLFMFGFWFLCAINVILMVVLIGFLTYPICWIAIMIISPIVAANSVKRY